ncbi:sensor histidine kinase [Clostridium sp. DL1XJH146]
MSINKLWLMILTLVAIISIAINTLILTSLTDRYFNEYISENYENHLSQIIDYTEKALLEESVSYTQMEIELENHLNDPIIGIKLYNSNGDILAYVNDSYDMSGMMMNGKMMKNMWNSTQDEVDQYIIKSEGETIGILSITRYSSAENSFVARMFKSTLFMNSLYAVIIAITISIVVGIFVSKKMGKALKDTADMALNIDFGSKGEPEETSITEINTIRESLKSLDERLKIKQKNRKGLIDELVHQTRTPLTVLKSHLEAMEDGIVEMTDEEISICQNQIENITLIISNMSGMIDGIRDVSEVMIEPFEFNQLIKQIIVGLHTQFEKKGINLELVSNGKISMETDKYKLSQSIYNVLTNAYKYTNTDGNVRVSYRVYNDKLILEIQDNGIGIAQKNIDNIFNAYYRDDAVINIKGEGIGLYIVKENLSMIKGNIIVKSIKNEGSSFFVEVPVNFYNQG